MLKMDRFTPFDTKKNGGSGLNCGNEHIGYIRHDTNMSWGNLFLGVTIGDFITDLFELEAEPILNQKRFSQSARKYYLQDPARGYP